MGETHPPGLSETDAIRLEELLASPVFHGDAMPLDMLQGFLCAVLSAPEPIPPDTWIPYALDENPHYESEAQREEVYALITRLHDLTEAALKQGDGLDMQLYATDTPGEYDFETWCAGYLEGVDLSDPDWFETGNEKELDELLFPIELLAGEPDEFLRSVGQNNLSAAERADLLASSRDGLVAAVIDLFQYWREWRLVPDPVRRESPKVGRNDPCPCGSGRKYKRCCGSSESMQ